MNRDLLITLGVFAAVVIDLILIWFWRKRDGTKGSRRPAGDSGETVSSASQFSAIIDLDEGEKLQMTVEALPSEAARNGSTQSRIQITFTPTDTQQPSGIRLGPPESKLVSQVRLIGQKLTFGLLSLRDRASSLVGQIRSTNGKSPFSRVLQSMRDRLLLWTQPLELGLFALALTFFALSRLIGLEEFPIYFFTDEAVQSVLASDFIRDGFRNYDGILFPTYFVNDYFYSLSLSVYIQVLPYFLFGKSVFVTRALSVLFTLAGAAAIGLILKDIFRLRFWWVGTMLLSITPAWFLHSRTAFETALFVSLYTWFLFFYLLYRTRSPRFLYLALLFGGLSFYSYNPGQLIIVGTGLLLLLSDFRYHLRNQSTVLKGLVLLVILILPYLRFQLQHKEATYYHLRMLDSYWLHNIPLGEKLLTFLRIYLRGLNPAYWYSPKVNELIRHVMKGYGHILLATFPFALLGFVISLRTIRSSSHRVVLVAGLASPLGGALVDLGITRVLAFIIPAAILTALGLEAVTVWFSRRLSYKSIAVGLIVLLGWVNGSMLRDSLVNGPTWFKDYGLEGMQFGARQVFGSVKKYVEYDPESRIFISPSWTNGANILQQFFLPNQSTVHMGNAGNFLLEMLDLDETTLFVLTNAEYDEIVNSEKFTNIQVEQTLTYPDGRPGFHFVRMRYAPGAEAIFALEREARQKPVHEEIMLDGQMVQIQHSYFDMGDINNLFDGDTFTMVRAYDANPAVINLTFSDLRTLTGLTITTGSMDFTLTVRLFTKDEPEPLTYSQTFVDQPEDPTVELLFTDGPIEAHKVEIEVLGSSVEERMKIHLRELILH